MCNKNCVRFAESALTQQEIHDKKVLEVGSLAINGSLRPLLESFKPKLYIGTDIFKGPGVDVICKAEDLMKTFHENSFDILISTELMEHVRDWRIVISNFKKLVKPDGTILVTTRSPGFPYHGYPYDFWRYEVEDMQKLFSDCKIERLQKDPEKGVFIKIRKPKAFMETDLSDFELYSIIANKRINQLNESDFIDFTRRNRLYQIRERLHPTVLIRFVQTSLFSISS